MLASSRLSRVISTFCFLVCLLIPISAAAEQAESGDETVWISLGADAFETLRARTDLSFKSHALKAEAERSDVVVTRVHTRDLERISRVIHEKHHRCGGFMAHASFDQAQKALESAALPEVKALPKAFQINQGAVVGSLKSKLNRDRIRDTIDTLSTQFNNRFYLHPAGRNASIYIRNLWRGYAGQRPEVTVELYEHPGWTQPSVILTIPGTTLPDEVVVLGGHLDSITGDNGNANFAAPGADDNASGIAVLSEVIRATLANGFRPDRTVKFMGYAAEEVGLRGSQEIANAYQQSGVNVIAVLQLDMTAFRGSVNDIVLISDFTNGPLNNFVGRLVDTYQPNLSRTSSACGYACSDHASWTAAGFPASFPHEAKFGEGNPHIHTANDTLDVFGNNANHAIKFAHLAAAFMVETAFEPVQPPDPPTDLTAEGASNTSIDLSWQDGSDTETGFKIQSRLGTTGAFQTLTTVDADVTEFTVEDLPSGTEYSFRIRAVNSGGESANSNIAAATTLGEAPPANLTAAAISATEVSLSWEDRSTGETGFIVQGKLASAGSFQDLASVFGISSAVITGLDPQSDYLFRVRAIGGAGDSTYSNEAAATTFIGDPEPCVPGPSTLCLGGGRFKVEVDWQVGDTSGQAQVVPGASDDSGLLWFFQSDNWELLIKVLDGCGLNQHFWVFTAATTDLQYDLVVTDSWTGYRSTYTNTAGVASPAVTDIEAFATCAAIDPEAFQGESP